MCAEMRCILTVLEHFLNYVSFDTCSADEQEQVPSTDTQWALAKHLTNELKELGASSVTLSDKCYVYATIPANTDKKLPCIGFIAHMDTSPAISGKDVKARVVHDYDGKDIVLNDKLNIVLSVSEYPELLKYRGQDIVVTDGTTLLGADDKAGVAEIMAMAEYLLTHSDVKHGTIRIGFTPDEEVGRGADFFDVKGFNADYAYTIDGGELGEIEYENFNAASGHVIVYGNSIHPGSAKGKMLNAILVGYEFQSLLPVFENPAFTEGYEGFYHLDHMSGSVERAELHYILRDHDRAKLEQKKNFFLSAGDFLNAKYGKGTLEVTVKDSYYNMREKIEPHMFIIDNAANAMRELGIEPKLVPIRGGTDGARLSYMGLPCPNLCTGGANYHGKYEYVPVQSMERITELLIKLATVR